MAIWKQKADKVKENKHPQGSKEGRTKMKGFSELRGGK